jgi:hypothetical protein
LAQTNNDAENERLFIQRMLSLKRNDFWRDDPWWAYNLSHVRDTNSLIEEMYKKFGELLR